MPGYVLDHRSHLAAAQLYLGASAAASELSALWLHGLVTTGPSRPHLLLPHARRVEAAQTIIHRSRFVEDGDRTIVDGISVLRIPFLLMATAPRATTETLLGVALTARQRRLLDLTELAGRLDRVGRMPGRRKVERVLAALVRDGSDSVFESRVRDRLRAAGLRPSDGPLPVPVA